MFAESGPKLPAGIGTSTPEEVATAVVRAIERNHFEVDVAPLGMRAMTTFAGIAPGVSARMAKRFGADKVGEQLESGQMNKR
jgi:hypothetical protein